MPYTQTNFFNNNTRISYNAILGIKFKLQQFQLDYVNTINITGGIPSPNINHLAHSLAYNNQKDSFYASSESGLHKVERVIYPQDEYIINSFMKVLLTGNGIGTNILINEIIEARKLGYKYMTVSAAQGEGWNGYYTWARCGYSMDELDHAQFLELMAEHNRTETSIIELMKTPAGRSFWKEYGFWWEGYFDLTTGSENMIAFQNYLTSTGIVVIL